jgi:hypothetical protein
MATNHTFSGDAGKGHAGRARGSAPPDEPASAAAGGSGKLLLFRTADRSRGALDDTLEDVAFLREQLRCEQLFHAHQLELERSRLRAERERLLKDLGLLTELLERCTRPYAAAADDERAFASIEPSAANPSATG